MNNSSCDPQNGRCVCSRGWRGDDCTIPCEDGYFGVGCKEQCPEGNYGNKTCDHITGAYICKPGYIGLTCEHPCPSGTYGPHCSLRCDCDHGAECHHETGQCMCPFGWTGSSCNVPCPNGFYGPNCSQICKCQNNSTCRRNDGHCVCGKGWMGPRCEESELIMFLKPQKFSLTKLLLFISVCPEGFYGLHCIESCSCKSTQFVCHVAHGCVCRQGFMGELCDISTSAKRSQEPESASNNAASLTWGIVVAVILVCIIFAVLFYYRRRVANLKTEIAHVQYIADPTSLPDRHHFDNPVYAFQPPANDSTTLLNNAIRNDLRNSKPSNLDRYKLGYLDDDSSVGSSRAGTYSINFNTDTSQKNMNADLTNPGIYHSIDQPISEHVYDEIKHKEGYKETGKFVLNILKLINVR